jgi:hypothetical protein
MEQEQKRPNYMLLAVILILTVQALSQTYLAYRWQKTANDWRKLAEEAEMLALDAHRLCGP